MKKIYALPICLLLAGITASAQNISVNTTGASNTTNSLFEVIQPAGAAASTTGIFARHLGTTSPAYAIWAEATGAANKYAIVVPITGGNVGIGITAPLGRLDVQGTTARTGTAPTTPSFYVTGTLNSGQTGPAAGNIEFRHDNQTQGVGFGYNTIYQTGSNANQELNLLSRGTSPITLNAYAYSTGNVGIGTTTPGNKLEVYGPASNYPARVGSPDGYLLFGPANTGWSHFVTDRARFYFNTGGTFDTGNIGSYDEDLSLQTQGTTRITVLNSNGNVGIGTATPGFKLHVPSGYIGTDYINTTDNSVASGITGVMIKAGDNYLRTGTAAGVATFLNTNNGWIQNQTTLQSSANYNISGSGNVQTSFQLQGTNAIFGNANDIYANIRVIQNNSSTLQDGMYINYNSTGGAAAHLKFYANGTTERMRIDASSGNVGIGAGASPVYRLTVQGLHSTSQIRLFSDEFGQGINGANTANMNLWASEPGMTWDGVGIGNNIYNTTSFPRVTTTRGGSYMRLLNNQINFNVVNNSGGDIPGLKVSPGSYGFGGIAIGQYHTLSSHSNSWLYMGDENGGIYGGRGLALANAYVASAFYYPNGTHGTGKILTSDVNGYATWGNVWGGNIQYVSPTTDISTASSTMSDMAGVTITFTPIHSLVYVSFTAAGNYTGTLRPAQFAHFQIVKDGIVQKGTSAIVGEGDDWYGFQNTWNAAMIHPVSVTAGVATTIKVQWAFLSYSGTQTLWVRPSVEPVIHHRTLTILD